jgi:hypothetical protein
MYFLDDNHAIYSINGSIQIINGTIDSKNNMSSIDDDDSDGKPSAKPNKSDTIKKITSVKQYHKKMTINH